MPQDPSLECAEIGTPLGETHRHAQTNNHQLGAALTNTGIGSAAGTVASLGYDENAMMQSFLVGQFWKTEV